MVHVFQLFLEENTLDFQYEFSKCFSVSLELSYHMYYTTFNSMHLSVPIPAAAVL